MLLLPSLMVENQRNFVSLQGSTITRFNAISVYAFHMDAKD